MCTGSAWGACPEELEIQGRIVELAWGAFGFSVCEGGLGPGILEVQGIQLTRVMELMGLEPPPG